MLIKAKGKSLKKLIQQGKVEGVTPTHVARLADVLYELRKAVTLKDLPSWLDLHAYNNYKSRRLPPDKVLWAVKVTAQWRLTLQVKNGVIELQDYLQYH